MNTQQALTATYRDGVTCTCASTDRSGNKQIELRQADGGLIWRGWEFEPDYTYYLKQNVSRYMVQSAMNPEQVALLTRIDALMTKPNSIHNDVIRSIQSFIADELYNVADQAIADLEQSTYSTITCAASHHWAAEHDWFINHVQAPSPAGIWEGGRWIVYVRDNGSVLAFASIKALKIWAGY